MKTSITKRPSEMEVKEAIDVILSCRESYNTSLNYAVEYCRYGLTCTGDELRVQCLYILNNIQKWRPECAKEVRATLKAFVK